MVEQSRQTSSSKQISFVLSVLQLTERGSTWASQPAQMKFRITISPFIKLPPTRLPHSFTVPPKHSDRFALGRLFPNVSPSNLLSNRGVRASLLGEKQQANLLSRAELRLHER
ncbi:hypothetical protein K0M31_009530, partial [Melipona bicolor]